MSGAAKREIRAFGHRLDKSFLPEMRRKTGFLFQNPEDQLFMPTVREDVSIAPVNKGWERSRIHDWVEECMATAGIDHLRIVPRGGVSKRRKKGLLPWPVF
jgi:ABC-type cobalt transport system, ATPase component